MRIVPTSVAGTPVGAADRLAVYVHWPFCLSKCPYCDFNSHVREHIDEAGWRAGLLAELDHFAALVPGRTVGSVFFGGGTPSLMAPATVAAVIDRVAERWALADDAEITLEANPSSVEAGRFAGYRVAGVNRVSLGVQAFDDAALAFLGRLHDVGEARAAIEIARARFPRISFDLIYARPGQTPGEWRNELREALSRAGDHLSLYQLTLEPGTAFHAAAGRGELALPDQDAGAALYEVTQEFCEAAGLPAYEISNHAAQGAESRHNLAYWRGGEYVGIGPGAHGRLTIEGSLVATRQVRAPETWRTAVEHDGHGTRDHESVAADERIAELLMMGLRLTEGVARERFTAQTGRTLADAVPAERIEALAAEGLLVFDDRALRATPTGRRVLDSILAALLG